MWNHLNYNETRFVGSISILSRYLACSFAFHFQSRHVYLLRTVTLDIYSISFTPKYSREYCSCGVIIPGIWFYGCCRRLRWIIHIEWTEAYQTNKYYRTKYSAHHRQTKKRHNCINMSCTQQQAIAKIAGLSIVFTHASWDLSKYFHVRESNMRKTPISNEIMAHSLSLTNQIYSNRTLHAARNNALAQFKDVFKRWCCVEEPLLLLLEMILHFHSPIWHLFYLSNQCFHFGMPRIHLSKTKTESDNEKSHSIFSCICQFVNS